MSHIVASGALSLLRGATGLANTVHRDAQEEFRGGVGDKVRIRRPEILEAKNFAGSVNAMAKPIKENTVELEITDQPLVATDLTDREMRFSIADFETQVTGPQVAGVADYLEQHIANTISARSAANALGLITMDPKNPRMAIIDAMTYLDKARVSGTRYLAVDPDVKNALMKDDNFSQVSQAGTAESLRGGVIGSAHGFVVVFSPYMKGAVAYVESAFAMAVCQPVAVRGTFSSGGSDRGYAMRWLLDFNGDTLKQRSVMDCYVGSTVLDERRSVGLALKSV
ncbi:P22 phage major capsid protein family protein [Streptomyces cinnamoneus]|uniref:P22 phage major capsid protein family protein n=1 Tax=Streptomyces cinnamoneus TaxID=53446 RepID=UPI00379CD239